MTNIFAQYFDETKLAFIRLLTFLTPVLFVLSFFLSLPLIVFVFLEKTPNSFLSFLDDMARMSCFVGINVHDQGTQIIA